MIWKPEEEKLMDFVFRFNQLAYELGYSDEQQISHFVLCIPRGLYLYLEEAQTIPDAVENFRKGIALGGLDNSNLISRTAQDDSEPTVPFKTVKENRTQFTTEDTLRAVKESMQDSRYDDLVKLLANIGDKLANVADVVGDFQRKQSSRDRDKDRSNSRDRDYSRDNSRDRDRRIVETITEIEVEMTVEINIEIGLTQEMGEIKERINKDLEQVKDTLTRIM